MSALRLEAHGIVKTFGAVRALRGVELEIRPGEVHALVGENGAGKSTIINVLSGSVKPDAGHLMLDGEPYDPRRPHDALAAGIGTVHQDPQLIPGMTVAENILLGRFPSRAGWMSGSMTRIAAQLLERLEIDLRPEQSCERISFADKQLIQIARAASFDRLRLLILDEPTSTLTPSEADRMFGLVDRLKAQGVSILYVSHRLDEVIDHADAVTVFRDGSFVSRLDRGAFDIDRLVQLMVGRDLDVPELDAQRAQIGESVLQLEGLTGEGFHDVDLEVRKGEILGLFGLVGAGRSETMRAVFGADAVARGRMRLNGVEFAPRSVREAVRHGVAMIPEDRRGQGLISTMSIAENMTIARPDSYLTSGFVNRRKERTVADRFREMLGIKMPAADAPIGVLSGGNQQKVVIGRWLETEPSVLILDEPAAGIDIGAKSDIYLLLEKLAADGMTMILVSSELPEILRLSDRVAVMRKGRVVGVVDRADATEENLLHLAAMG
jgi:ABC-type sugar transport system ATPase subunit